MRTIFLILLIIASINKGKSQCWEIIYDGGTNIVFTDLEVLNDSILWVAADLIAQNQNLGLRTENGGGSWNIVTWSFSDFPPRKISLIDQNTAVVASNRVSVYKTDDKGWSWDEIDLPQTGDNNPIRNNIFQSTNEGWLTIDKSSILYTGDGGLNWEEKGNNVEGGIPFIPSFQVVTDSIFYFYGFWNLSPYNNGRIWKTIDKGESWSMLDIQLPTNDMNLFFLNDTTGWVGCQNNTICKTTDGGETWLEYPVINNPENYFRSTSFINDSIGWISGAVWDSPGFLNGFIAYSGDGGENWYRQQLSIDTSNVLDFQNNNEIKELQMVNDTLGYAISSRGRIYRYRGRAADCGPTPVLLGTNVLSPSFSWAAAEGCFDGYYFQIGSSPGEDDLLPPTDVGLDTFFHATAPLPENTTAYATVRPYNHQFGAAQSCESTVFLTPDCPPAPIVIDTGYCAGSPLLWGDSLINAPGTYTFPAQALTGCDSTTVLKVEAYAPDTSFVDTFFCSGSDGLLWGDSLLPQPGAYTFAYLNAQGCDSTVQVSLALANSSFSAIDTFYCEGEPFWWGDTLLPGPGLHTLAYRSAEGCDSALQVTLQARNNSYVELDTALSPGAVFMGSAFYTDTTFTQLHPASNSCDSLTTIHIEIISNTRAAAKPSTWRCYPNPAQDLLWAEGPSPNARLQLWSAGGQRVGLPKHSLPAPDGAGRYRYAYNISHLPPGLYWLQITWEGGTALEKVVKM
jgi:photosystem II stability/assembly factor-like uncharacterized protein